MTRGLKAAIMTDPEEKDQGLLWVVAAGAVGLLVLGLVYYRFRSLNDVWTLADHANLGSALAPAVAFLTLLQIQRTELALQRKELQSTRAEMVEQRKQFEATATAQKRLADSQEKLASEQHVANGIALQQFEQQMLANRLTAASWRQAEFLELAQRANVVATLRMARATTLSALTGESSLEASIASSDLSAHIRAQEAAYEELRQRIESKGNA
jgi:hypothetical protein